VEVIVEVPVFQSIEEENEYVEPVKISELPEIIEPEKDDIVRLSYVKPTSDK
jgi:hypothetical protein